MKVPVYQPQVSLDTPNVPVPRSPGANRDAFGGQVYKAQENLGQVGSDIAGALNKHAQIKAKIRNDSAIAQADTDYRLAMQNRVFSNDPEEYEVNGQKLQRPVGLLNRQLDSAVGSTEEFDRWHNTQLNEVLKNFQDQESRDKLVNSLNNHYFTMRDNVIGNEAKQERAGNISRIESNISQKLRDASVAQDPISLSLAVDNIASTQAELNMASGFDKETGALNIKKTVSKLAETSIISALDSDITGAKSMLLLNGIQDKLDPVDYKSIGENIKESSKKLIKAAQENAKQTSNINSAKILTEVSEGKFNVFNVKEINRMANAGEISNESAAAAIRAIEKPISSYDIKPDDEAFVSRVNGIFEIGNAEDLERNLIEVIEGYSSGKLDQERMTLLFQAAQKHGEDKVNAYRDNYKRIYDWSVEAGIPVTYKSQIAKDYLAGMNAGKSPQESADIAISKATFSQNERPIQQEDVIFDGGTDPKEYLSFSERLLTTPTMNTLFNGLQRFSDNRVVKNIGLGQAGVVEGVGGAAKMVGLKNFGDAVGKEAKKMRKTFEVKDPNFWDKLGQGASSSLSFFVPGLAVAKGVTLVKAAPIIAAALGVGTSSVLESAVEGGGNYEEALRRGMTEEEARNIGGATFWLNMPLLVGTNLFGGLFTPQGKAAKEVAKKWTFDRIAKAIAARGLKPSASEGAQEGLQQVAGNISIGDPAGRDVRDSTIIGAIVGGGLGVAMSVSDVQGEESGGNRAKFPPGDGPKDNIVRDKSGKPIEINTPADKEAQKLAEQIAVKKGVVAGAMAGVETISNGGNSKEVALNSAIASNLEIINGFSNFDSKVEATKNIDRAVFEYLMQDGMPKAEAAALSQKISAMATESMKKTYSSQEYRTMLLKSLELAIPAWRFTSPSILSSQEQAARTAKPSEIDATEKAISKSATMKQLIVSRNYAIKSGKSADIERVDSLIEKNAKEIVENAGGKFVAVSKPGEINYDAKDPVINFNTPGGGTKQLNFSELSDESVKKSIQEFEAAGGRTKPISLKDINARDAAMTEVKATSQFTGDKEIDAFGEKYKDVPELKEALEKEQKKFLARGEELRKIENRTDEQDIELMNVGQQAQKYREALQGLAKAKEVGAPKNVAPTGSKEKSASYQRALERYIEELKEQPEASYTTINLADQMARAFKFVEENLALAKKIAYGMEPAPAGLRESAISIAYNEKMFQDGNIKEFGRSYRSRSLRQTTRGQEIVLEKAAAVNQNHPLYFARQVIEARTALAGKKLFDIKGKENAPAKKAYKKIKADTSTLKKEIVDSKKLDIEEAQKIIDSLIC
jgi:hypothetical protein